ncbi:hypothetical protein GBL_0680 [Geobacillus kaustophilus GBlys]|uniref:Uncharacterized protein n=1 Tax=Geobacillus kaustophilus GBlys TaxID=1337888 RepID=U2Y773_GEOKU|nr:hypothetical protein GBL_0680 [Geobacillus kaustophilus GBlys]
MKAGTFPVSGRKTAHLPDSERFGCGNGHDRLSSFMFPL